MEAETYVGVDCHVELLSCPRPSRGPEQHLSALHRTSPGEGREKQQSVNSTIIA